MEDFQMALEDGTVITLPAFLQTTDKRIVHLPDGEHILAVKANEPQKVLTVKNGFVIEIKNRPQ